VSERAGGGLTDGRGVAEASLLLFVAARALTETTPAHSLPPIPAHPTKKKKIVRQNRRKIINTGLPRPGPPDNPYPQWLTYLTNWSMALLAAAGLLGAANLVRVCRLGRGGGGAAAPERRPPWDALSVAHQLASTVAVTAALFVTIFFWGGVVGLGRLKDGGAGALGGLDATTYLAHAGNSGAAALLLLATRLPVASPHFLALLWYATAYTIFAWIYGTASGGDWRYGLDWRKGGPAVAYALVPLFAFFVFFGVAFAIAALREAVGWRVMMLRSRKGGGRC